MNKWTKALLGASILFVSSSAFADAPAPSLQPPDQGMYQTFIMLGIAFLFFYLILWRPEQKRRKALEAQRSALKKGDKVTAMGIVGTISRIKEQTVILNMVDGAKIEMLKGAINEVMPEGEVGTDVSDDKEIEKKNKDKD